jgi:hypothetical protein
MKAKKIIYHSILILTLAFFLSLSNKALAASECSSCDSDMECGTGMTCPDCRSQEAIRNCPGSGCGDAAGRCVPISGGGGGGSNCTSIGGVCVAKTADGLCSDGRVGAGGYDYCADDSKMCCGNSGGISGGGMVVSTNSCFGLPCPAGGIAQILANLLSWLLYIFGIIALISFVVSGMQYFFAVGDEKNMETAKRNLMYSIIGIIVALSGLVIIQAVDAALRGYSFF